MNATTAVLVLMAFVGALFVFGVFVGSMRAFPRDRAAENERASLVERCKANAERGIGVPVGECDGHLVAVETFADWLALMALPSFARLRREHQ